MNRDDLESKVKIINRILGYTGLESHGLKLNRDESGYALRDRWAIVAGLSGKEMGYCLECYLHGVEKKTKGKRETGQVMPDIGGIDVY